MSYPTLTEIKRAKVARMSAAVEDLARDLATYAREHGGRFILFGSAARGELRHDSDVDILVDFPVGEVQDNAYYVAEDRAFAHGLKPDVHHKGWSGSRLLERVDREGRVLEDGFRLEGKRPLREKQRVRDDRWIDVGQDAAAAARYFRAAARIYDDGSLNGPNDLDRLMALMHYMQSGHTSFEAALLRVLQILDEAAPTGSDWHAQLIARCGAPIAGSRPAILTAELLADAHQTRTFRHIAMHSYDLTFEPQKARRAITAGSRLADTFPIRIDAFIREIDS